MMQQEGSHALFRGLLSEDQQQSFVLDDPAAHLVDQAPLNYRRARTQTAQLLVWQGADTGSVEDHGVAHVAARFDGVQTNRVAGCVEADDLLIAALQYDVGLDRPGAHRVDVLETFGGAEQMIAAVQNSGYHRDLEIGRRLAVIPRPSQASCAECALVTGGSACPDRDDLCGALHGPIPLVYLSVNSFQEARGGEHT